MGGRAGRTGNLVAVLPLVAVREAELLASVADPALVAHVAHGEDDGLPWLAMEWVDGPSLAARLAVEPLSPHDTLLVGRRLAAALATLHGRGIVHRDVKPSNVSLASGEPARAVLLDLGVARPLFAAHALTATNLAIGTVGYMAPEQARGEGDVDARADVFALGAVLYECLAGEPAFRGDNVVAILSALLCEAPRPLLEARPELPASLDELVSSLLAKDRRARPRDAAAVLRALASIDVPADLGRAGPIRRAAPLSAVEQQLSVVAVLTLDARSAEDETEFASEHDASVAKVRDLARTLGAEAVPLPGGAVLLVTEQLGTAADRAILSASTLRAVIAGAPSARAGLASGLAPTGDRGGVVLARALRLASGRAEPGVAVDDPTAELLAARFAVSRAGDAWELGADREERADRAFGRPVPFVGREKELALLEATVAEAIDESAPRAALVFAPPGAGKSRLGRELAARLRKRGDVTLLEARAEATRAGAVHSLLAGLVRSAAGLGATPEGEGRERVRAYVRGLPGVDAPDRLADFLAWMAGFVSLDGAGPELTSAAGDRELLSKWIRRTLRDWLSAAAAAAPVVLLLEDLHWSDGASLQRLDEVLRAVRTRPLIVVGLARPEARDELPLAFPAQVELRLEALGARAAERMVRALLGADADPGVVAGIVGRALGNPLFLLELSRFVKEGRGDELPVNVVAVLESRIGRLDPGLRRILRAASVIGERVSAAGVAAVAGDPEADVSRALHELAATEIVSVDEDTPGAFVFAHALVREVAYASLSEDDRRISHARAASFLERGGAPDPRGIARHWESAGEPRRAIPWIVQAATYAIDVGAESEGFALAEHGIGLGAEGIELGHLGLYMGMAAASRNDQEGAVRWVIAGLDNIPPTHPLWPFAAGAAVFMASSTGRMDLGARVVVTWLMAGVRVTKSRTAYMAAFLLSLGLARMGRRQELGMLQDSTEPPDPRAPAEVAIHELVSCPHAYFCTGRPGEIQARTARSQRAAEACDDAFVLGNAAYFEARIRALATVSPAVADQLDAWVVRHRSSTYPLTVVGIETAAAIAHARTDPGAIDALRGKLGNPDRSMAELAHHGLVTSLIRAGRLDEAERELDGVEAPSPYAHAAQRVHAARITAMRGEHERALVELADAEALLREHALVWQWEYLHAARVDSLRALGRDDEARGALGDPRARLDVSLAGADEEFARFVSTSVEPVVSLSASARALGAAW